MTTEEVDPGVDILSDDAARSGLTGRCGSSRTIGGDRGTAKEEMDGRGETRLVLCVAMDGSELPEEAADSWRRGDWTLGALESESARGS